MENPSIKRTALIEFLKEKSHKDISTGSSLGGVLGGLSKKCEANLIYPLIDISQNEQEEPIYDINESYRPFITDCL